MRKLLFLLCFFIGLQGAYAFEIPENSNQTVLDQANVFSLDEERSLRQLIYNIEEETTVEVAVWTVGTLDGYPIFNAALEAGRKWGVGQKENNNGLVLLIAVDDRDWFMVTGYGVEGTLPDVTVKRIGERYFPPNFRQGNYARGVELALNDIKALLVADPTVVAEYDRSLSFLDFIRTVVAVLLFFVFSVVGKKYFELSSDIDTIKTVFYFIFSPFVYGLVLLGLFMVFEVALFGFVALVFALIRLMFPRIEGGGAGRGGGGSGRFNNSSWSDSNSWSSGGGFNSGGFGGGSFGGGGGGGSW